MGLAAATTLEEVVMGRVTPEELAEWQDPATWEDDEDPVRPPVHSPRAIVSVAFSRDDFIAVADYASRHGMKTSEFIRRATLERLSSNGQEASVAVTGVIQTGDAAIAPPRPDINVQTSPRQDPAA
jgi:hypothetical protein